MEKIDWAKILRLLLSLSFWTVIAVIPLGMSFFFPVMSPFLSVKSALLSILGAAAAILAAFSLRLWRGHINGELSGRLVYLAPAWIFFIIFAMLTIWSSDPMKSWVGSYERQFGLLSYFWIFFWYSFGAIKFSSQGRGGWLNGVKLLSLLTTAIGTLIAVYSFLQFCGIDFSIWQEPQLLNRAIGTLGQPNFLGSFLAMSLALTTYLLFSSGRKGRVCILPALLIQFCGLAVSGSRSAWLAAIVVGVGVVIISAWKRYRAKSLLMAAAIVLVSLSILFLIMPDRINSLSDFNQGSPALRRYFYQAGFKAFAAKPWLGTGLENGGEGMISAYEPDWGIFLPIDGYTDKAHNSVLDMAIQTGVIGLLVWLGLYAYLAWRVVRLYKKEEGKPFALAAGAAMSIYGISIFFGLSDIADSFFFWVIAAAVVGGNFVFYPRPASHIRDFRFRRPLGLAFSVLIILLSLGQLAFSLGSLQADYYFLQLNRALIQEDHFTAASLYSYLSSTAFNGAHREYYQRSYASHLLVAYESAQDETTRSLIFSLLKELRASLPARGADNLLVVARLDCFFEDSRSAPLFETVISISPQRPLAYRERAVCRARHDDVSGALSDYSQALSLLPSANDPRINIEHLNYLRFYTYLLEKERGNLFSSQGKLEEALTSYKEAYNNYPDDIGLYLPISGLLVEMHRVPEAEEALKHAYLREPLSYRWPLELAALKQRTGDKASAMDYAREASALAPEESLPLPTASQY
ncbi:MAG: O-antigen ligase family protein [Bacillota bacterium]